MDRNAENITQVVRSIQQAAEGVFTRKQLAAYKKFNIAALKTLIADRFNDAPDEYSKDRVLNAVRRALAAVQCTLNRDGRSRRWDDPVREYDVSFYHELMTSSARETLEVICLHPNEDGMIFKGMRTAHGWLGAIHYAAAATSIIAFLDASAYNYHPQLHPDCMSIIFVPPFFRPMQVGRRVQLKPGACSTFAGVPFALMTPQEAERCYRKFCYFISGSDIRCALSATERSVLDEIDRLAREYPSVRDYIACGIRRADQLPASGPEKARRYAQLVRLTVAELVRFRCSPDRAVAVSGL